MWQDPGGRERTRAFQVKAVAAEHAAKMAADVARGTYQDPALGRALVAAVGAKWLGLLEGSARTQERYESVYRVHVEPKFGGRPVSAVQPSEVAAWSRTMADHPATRRAALLVLAQVLELAVADGLIRDNPARSAVVSRPVVPKLERRPWTADMVHAVAERCGQRGALPLVAAGLGLRASEVFALAASDVDGNVVHVRRQVSVIGGRWHFKLPKGGRARTVPLSTGVAALLGRLAPERYGLPWANEDGTTGPVRTADLFWLWRDGRHLRADVWDKSAWKPALAAAGIITGDTRRARGASRENGMHALRHFFATTLLDGGVSVAGVMQFMGHSRRNVPLVVGTYGHVTDETWQAARDAVDLTLFRPRLAASDGTRTEPAVE